MKKLKEYLAEGEKTRAAKIKKPKKIMAPQDSAKEALWNSTDDRWSRKAKHPRRANELFESDIIDISTDKLQRYSEVYNITQTEGNSLTEGVIGGMQPLNPIGRMMQLAGIASHAIIEPVAEDKEEKKICKKCGNKFTPTYGEYSRCPECLGKQHDAAERATGVQENELHETDSSNVFDQLVTSQLNGEFKNNEPAARLAALGQILIGTSDIVGDLKIESSGAIPPDVMTKLEALDALGAMLIIEARKLNKPQG